MDTNLSPGAKTIVWWFGGVFVLAFNVMFVESLWLVFFDSFIYGFLMSLAGFYPVPIKKR